MTILLTVSDNNSGGGSVTFARDDRFLSPHLVLSYSRPLEALALAMGDQLEDTTARQAS